MEDIAILGDLGTLWSLDYDALVWLMSWRIFAIHGGVFCCLVIWRVFTLEELGGLWRYTWRGFEEALMMTWMLCYIG